MTTKLAFVNGSLSRLSGIERTVLEAVVDAPSKIPVVRVVPRGVSGLAFGLNLPAPEITDALAGLRNSGVLHGDGVTGLFWLPEAWHSQWLWARSPNHVKGWFYEWSSLPKTSPITYASLVTIRRLVPLATESQSFARVWRETFAGPLYDYLRWGGLDHESARTFSALLNQNEIQSLPVSARSNARKQIDKRLRRKGLLTEREARAKTGALFQELPPEWGPGIAPLLADCLTRTVPQIVFQSSRHPSSHQTLPSPAQRVVPSLPPGGLSGRDAAVQTGRLCISGSLDQREEKNTHTLERDRDTTATPLEGASDPKVTQAREVTGESPAKMAQISRHHCDTTTRDTTTPVVSQWCRSGVGPPAAGSKNTHEGNKTKHGKTAGRPAGNSSKPEPVRPAGQINLRPYWDDWYPLLKLPVRLQRYRDSYGEDPRELEGFITEYRARYGRHPLEPAQRDFGGAEAASGVVRRPRGVPPAAGAGALASLASGSEPGDLRK